MVLIYLVASDEFFFRRKSSEIKRKRERSREKGKKKWEESNDEGFSVCVFIISFLICERCSFLFHSRPDCVCLLCRKVKLESSLKLHNSYTLLHKHTHTHIWSCYYTCICVHDIYLYYENYTEGSCSGKVAIVLIV